MLISSSQELKALQESGAALASIVQRLKAAVEPGKNAAQINDLAKQLAAQEGYEVAFEGYDGFPSAVCISLNDEVAHGLPVASKVFKEGDIVSIDFGLRYKDLYTDHAVSFCLGAPSLQKGALLEVTEQALQIGIQNTRTGVRTGDVGFCIEEFIKSKGEFGIIRRLVGHGIGYNIHEDPKIPNFGTQGTGYQFQEGEVVAIEPMVSLGSEEIILAPDNFTYKTVDGSLSAHFEKTIVIYSDKVLILT